MRIWLTDRWEHILSSTADWQETRTQSTLECTKSQYIGRRRNSKKAQEIKKLSRPKEEFFSVREQAHTLIRNNLSETPHFFSLMSHLPAIFQSRKCLAATAGLGTNSLARQIDASAGTARRLRFVALLDLRSHGHEGLLYVGGALSRGLNECNAQRVGEFLHLKNEKIQLRWDRSKLKHGRGNYLGLVVRHSSLGGKIRLVSDKKLVHVLGSISEMQNKVR